MAIAFFIPDQNKLLASYSSGNGSIHNTTNILNNQNIDTSHVNSSNNNTASQTETNQEITSPNGINNNESSGSTTSSVTTNNIAAGNSPHFRANITIPLTAYGSSSHNNGGTNAVGCWELFAQVFWYAMGCYRATILSPATVHISFEFNSGRGFVEHDRISTQTHTREQSPQNQQRQQQ